MSTTEKLRPAVLALTVAIVAAIGLALTLHRARAPAAAAATAATSARIVSVGASPQVPTDTSFAVPLWHGEFASHVRRKYRYLLEDARLDATSRDALVQLLLEREALADPDLAQEPLLARIDDRLRALLHPGDYVVYGRLRDSDAEQVELEEFVTGLDEYAPLDTAQRRALLEARLRHKQDFTVALAGSGVAPEALLLAYRDAFLGEARPLLDDRQYLALVSYETTEFDRQLESLQVR